MDTQLDAELRANILVEALPYIQEYYGQTVVVKYGGNAMINEELKDAVIHDLVLLNLVGVKVVIVHGGGPEINEMLGKIGKESKFVNGLRYTDRETMDIVQMVLCGQGQQGPCNPDREGRRPRHRSRRHGRRPVSGEAPDRPLGTVTATSAILWT